MLATSEPCNVTFVVLTLDLLPPPKTFSITPPFKFTLFVLLCDPAWSLPPYTAVISPPLISTVMFPKT